VEREGGRCSARVLARCRCGRMCTCAHAHTM
jgi:hypothetical protein